MLFRKVVQNGYAHFFPVRCGKEFDRCAIKCWTYRFFGIQSGTAMVVSVLHTFTPFDSIPNCRTLYNEIKLWYDKENKNGGNIWIAF